MFFIILGRLLLFTLLICLVIYAQRQLIQYFWLKLVASTIVILAGYNILYYGYFKSFYRKKPVISVKIDDIITNQELKKRKRLKRSSSLILGIDEEEPIEEEEDEETTSSMSPPLTQQLVILSTFFSSSIKVFSFLDPQISQQIAEHSEQVIISAGNHFNIEGEEKAYYYLLAQGKMQLYNSSDNICELIGPSAISALFSMLADLLTLPKNSELDLDLIFTATTNCIMVKIGRQGLDQCLHTQMTHFIRVFMARFRRVTVTLCKKYLTHLLNDLIQIYEQTAIDNVNVLDEQLIQEHIGVALKCIIPQTIGEFLILTAGQCINLTTYLAFCIIKGKLNICFGNGITQVKTSGYCNVISNLIFENTLIEKVTAETDCRVLAFKDLDLFRNNLESLKMSCQVLYNNMSKDLLLVDSYSKWQRFLPGQPLTTNEVKVILHGRVKEGEHIHVAGESLFESFIFDSKTSNGQQKDISFDALRETEVAGLPSSLLRHFAERVPQVALNLASISLHQKEARPKADQYRTVAIIPMTHEFRPLTLDFAHRLENVLMASTQNSCHLLDSALVLNILGRDAFQPIGKLKLQEFLAVEEDRHRVLLLLTLDGPRSSWTRQCLKNADLVLVVADGMQSAEQSRVIGEYELLLKERMTHCRVQLVLIHNQWKRRLTGASQWLTARPWVQAHSHVFIPSTPGNYYRSAPRAFELLKRWQPRMMYERDELKPKFSERQEDNNTDLRRLARQILGRRLALVLSGGGARGCAHVGVIRALREAGIQVDIVGGASMGALVSALYADQAYSWYALPTLLRFFADRMGSWWRQSLDLTLPVITWFTGHHLNRTLWKLFGDTTIDDLWIDFFCVTTDLTNNCLRVHRRGSDSRDFLWRYLRASMSLGGVVPPICDRQGSILVDGGYANNIPIDVVLGEPFNAELVLVVDISKEVQFPPHSFGDTVSGWMLLLRKLLGVPLPTPDFTDIQMQLIYLTTNLQQQQWINYDMSKVIMLRPPVLEYDTFEFHQWRDIMQIGYEYGQAMVAKWRLDGTIDRLLFLQGSLSSQQEDAVMKSSIPMQPSPLYQHKRQRRRSM